MTLQLRACVWIWKLSSECGDCPRLLPTGLTPLLYNTDFCLVFPCNTTLHILPFLHPVLLSLHPPGILAAKLICWKTSHTVIGNILIFFRSPEMAFETCHTEMKTYIKFKLLMDSDNRREIPSLILGERQTKLSHAFPHRWLHTLWQTMLYFWTTKTPALALGSFAGKW